MSLIATLFTNSCADGALVPAGGGVWARATEANRQQPIVISSDLFMICTPGSCGSRAAQLTNLGRTLLVPRHGSGERDRPVKSNFDRADLCSQALRCSQTILSVNRRWHPAFRSGPPGRKSFWYVRLSTGGGSGPGHSAFDKESPAEAGHYSAIRRLRPAG